MEPYLDLSRVAIWVLERWRFQHAQRDVSQPDVYHVGIAVVPKPQPRLYNAWFQEEIYMRTREVNAEGYERSVPTTSPEGLAGQAADDDGVG